MVDKNLLIREWLNGSLLPLTLNLSFVLAMYVSQIYFETRHEHSSFWKVPGVHTAFILFWVFLAESTRAGSMWFYLRMQNRGFSPTVEATHALNIVLILVGVVLVASVLRCTYLFSPPMLRGVFWVYSLSLTVVFVLLSHMIH
jgi:hypothetical protein